MIIVHAITPKHFSFACTSTRQTLEPHSLPSSQKTENIQVKYGNKWLHYDKQQISSNFSVDAMLMSNDNDL